MIAVTLAVFPNTQRDYCWHSSDTWTSCKKINASSFLVPTTFSAQFVFRLYFFPKVTHRAARFVCDSWPTCFKLRNKWNIVQKPTCQTCAKKSSSKF